MILSKDSHIGGEEIIKDYIKRLYKCKIISKTAELWQLDKEKFLHALKHSIQPIKLIYKQFNQIFNYENEELNKKIKTYNTQSHE